MINTMAADGLGMKGARASAVMLLNLFSGLFQFKHQYC